jgi:Dolichyl-phosphate-mannose-protein mannosyltransferase
MTTTPIERSVPALAPDMTPVRTAPVCKARVSTTPATRVALALLILVACLLSASTWRVYSNTWDEPEHLAAGIELLDRGKYEYDTEHPPIVRALMALGPYLAGARSFGTPPPDGTQEGIDILYTGGHYDLYLTLARLGALPFLAMLLLAAWLWARRLTGSAGEALLAVLLLACVPPVLGHAALATLDVAAAATMLLALYALQSWLGSASWRDALFFGITAGVAVATKFSAIPFLVLGFLVLAIAQVSLRSDAGQQSQPEGPQTAAMRRRLAGFAVVVLVAAVPIAIAYGVRSSSANGVLNRFDRAVDYLLREHGLSHAAGVLLGHVWLPRWMKGFIEGVVALKAHNDTGHLSFLLGHLRATGWWYFYLVALAAKTPLPLLATGPVGMAILAREGWREKDGWRLAPVLLFLSILGFASAFSRINIGIRHVLILYPFMALGGAHAVILAWRALQRPTRYKSLAILGTATLVAMVGWQVSTLWIANPDYLPYFNEAVPHPAKVLVDSDLDWGQDLWRLEQRAAAIKVPRLSLAYRGTADLSREALPPTVIMPPWHPRTGWIAISALAREHDPAGYAWLDAYKPVERIGKTIDLYYIPAAR